MHAYVTCFEFWESFNVKNSILLWNLFYIPIQTKIIIQSLNIDFEAHKHVRLVVLYILLFNVWFVTLLKIYDVSGCIMDSIRIQFMIKFQY